MTYGESQQRAKSRPQQRAVARVTHSHTKRQRVERLQVQLVLTLRPPAAAAASSSFSLMLPDKDTLTQHMRRGHAPASACRKIRCAAARAARRQPPRLRRCRWKGHRAAPRGHLRECATAHAGDETACAQPPRAADAAQRGATRHAPAGAPSGASVSAAVDMPPYSLSANVCQGCALHVSSALTATLPRTRRPRLPQRHILLAAKAVQRALQRRAPVLHCGRRHRSRAQVFQVSAQAVLRTRTRSVCNTARRSPFCK
jgi:hypothetical protein